MSNWNRIITSLNNVATTSLQEISFTLEKIASSLEKTVSLNGPFSKYVGDDSFEVEVSFMVQSLEFQRSSCRNSGISEPFSETDLQDMAGPEHTITLDVTFSYSKPERDVGWIGGTEISDYSVVALDGIALSSQDGAQVASASEQEISDAEEDFISEEEISRSERAQYDVGRDDALREDAFSARRDRSR